MGALMDWDAVNLEAKRPFPESVVTLRAEQWSADGDNVVISLRVRDSIGERKYSVPIVCLQDLIVDLRRLHASMPWTDDVESEPLLPLGLPLEMPQ